MESLIEKLTAQFEAQIKKATKIGKAEMNIEVYDGIDTDAFANELKKQIVAIINELTIMKINIINASGKVTDSFATNQ